MSFARTKLLLPVSSAAIFYNIANFRFRLGVENLPDCAKEVRAELPKVRLNGASLRRPCLASHIRSKRSCINTCVRPSFASASSLYMYSHISPDFCEEMKLFLTKTPYPTPPTCAHGKQRAARSVSLFEIYPHYCVLN
ncbi:hypothetical protein ES703_25956 [subsurface metagenome]